MSNFEKPDDRFSYKKIQIPVRRLDSVINEFKDIFPKEKKYGLLLDVEGTEKNALKSLFEKRIHYCQTLF